MSEDKDRIIYELWKLLDNIDTASDIAKDNTTLYIGMVNSIQKQRWRIIEEDFVDELYDKYHPKDEEE